MKTKTYLPVVMSSCLLLITGALSAHAYEIGKVVQGGTIHGQVSFSGIPPAPLVVPVDKEPEVCGEQRSLVKVETHNGLLTGVVMVLEGIQTGKPFSSRTFHGPLPGEGEFRYQGGPTLGLRVKTKACNFGPFTGVIAANEAVQFENQDTIKHTLHTFAAMDTRGLILRTVHNQDIHPQDTIEREFEAGKLRGSRVVRITCNRHDFMQNWLYVVDHPYFAMTDKEGRFHIDQVPPGTYTLLAWHPILGEQRQEVQVTADGSFTARFHFERQ